MGQFERRLAAIEGMAEAEIEALRARQEQALGRVIPRLEERHKIPLVRLLRSVAHGKDPEGDLDAMRAAWAHFLDVTNEDEIGALLPLPGFLGKVEAKLE
jgi:hypothetical protein